MVGSSTTAGGDKDRDSSTTRAIILAAGRGIRRLDAKESTPTPLLETAQGEAILDTQIESLQRTNHDDIVCLAGYHIEKMVMRHTDINYYYDSEWEENGGLEGLAQYSGLLNGETFLVDGATLFDESAVKRLSAVGADVSVGVQRFPDEEAAKEAKRTLDPDRLLTLENDRPERVGDSGQAPHARLTDLVYLSPTGAKALRTALESVSEGQRNIPNLLDILDSSVSADLDVTFVELDDTVRRCDEDNGLARFLLGSKADTLERLRKHIERARFPEQVTITVEEYRRDPDGVVARVREAFREGPIVVRSSASVEDGWDSSEAGAFHSELDVDPTESGQVIEAIEAVVESIEGQDLGATGRDQILIQKQVVDVVLSGVAFTRDLDSGGPYTTINYDTSGRTDTVTAGQDTYQQTAYFYHGVERLDSERIDERVVLVKEAVDEIRDLLEDPPLDIEFAVDDRDRVIILQVRPMAVHSGAHRYDARDIDDEVESVASHVTQLDTERPLLFGDGTVLAVMPDWNPAEMLGTDPDPLAVSLYDYLITDEVWARGRAASGYRDVGPTSLMTSLAGRPYIDTLADFNSFLPASLPEELGERLVNHYVERLAANPHLQDKVEFEIAFTCLDFAFDARTEQLESAGFTDDEIAILRTHLRSLTDDIVNGDVATIDEQRQRLVRLAHRRGTLLDPSCATWSETARCVRQLLEDTRELGTLPFAILARYAFISKAFLRSLVERGVFTEAEIDTISEGVPTIAGELVSDTRRLEEGELDAESFLVRYGHLRPGTYDVCSPRYDEAPERYLDIASPPPDLSPLALDSRRGSAVADWSPSVSPEAQDLLDGARDDVSSLIEQEGFTFSVDDLYEFVTVAIPFRELAKFEFTRNLSAALTMLRRGTELELGLSPEQIARLPIRRLLSAATENPSPVLDRELERASNYNEKRSAIQRRVELPPVIRDVGDVRVFEVTSEQPNYITNKKTTAPVVQVDGLEDRDRSELEGAIAMIPAADPGYDWIFGTGVAGLVTKYGGIASHMAIRAAEFGLPAAIGCGDVVYNQMKAANVVELDCAAGRFRVVR